MSLSPQLQELKVHEQDYEASEATKEKLSGKVLTALIAPTAVGKSTIIQRVLELGGEDFSESYSVVTRPRRVTDPAGYKTSDEGYTIERMIDMIKAQKLTHYMVHPSGNIYGSLPDSFPAMYNLLPCVPYILDVVRKAGFSAVNAVYIVTSAADWAERLPERRNDSSYIPRLTEAVESLRWAIVHTNELIFIENASGQLDQAAQTILNVTRGEASDYSQDHGMSLAKEMLAFAQTELDHLNTQ